MRTFSLTHLSDGTLLRDLAALVARDRTTTVALIAHIAEVDARRLYAPAGYPSMFAYCVEELGLSEQAAFRRIHAARLARRFPDILPAVADGRLHLTALGLLAPYLSEENASDLLAAAARKRKTEIEVMLAERFPRSEVLPWIAEPAVKVLDAALPPAQSEVQRTTDQLSERVQVVSQLCPDRVESPEERPRPTPPHMRHASIVVSRPLHHNAMSSNSPSARAPATSSSMPRPCSGTRSPRAISRKCSTARWTR